MTIGYTLDTDQLAGKADEGRLLELLRLLIELFAFCHPFSICPFA